MLELRSNAWLGHDSPATVQETGLWMIFTYRDPKARPSAKDALQDPWLKGNSTERNQGKPIDATVVQRIQVSTCCPYPVCKT